MNLVGFVDDAHPTTTEFAANREVGDCGHAFHGRVRQTVRNSAAKHGVDARRAVARTFKQPLELA